MTENTLLDNYAPVLIITLNRFEHFKCCVESLSKCTHADKTDLYIALDYPLNESHWEGYDKIKEYIDEIDGFKSTIVIERNENYGMLKNYSDAIQVVLSKHERFIFSEDDNEFSPNFLDYINKGLDKFNDDPNVFAICGYQFPLDLPPLNDKNYYFRRGLSAWGYGSWKSKFKNIYYTNDELIRLSKNWQFIISTINRSPSSFLTLVDAICNKKDFYGDMAIAVYMAINKNIFSVFPYISKVRNHGHDGTGVHCEKIISDLFLNQIIDSNLIFEYSNPASLDKSILGKKLKKYFNPSIISIIRVSVIYIIFRIKNIKI